jgi:carbon-monoxide dehydrogenase small subunit
MSKIALGLTINGERHEVLTEPHRTLLDVLRVDLGLTGTKENCLEAECGVCTVLLDGRAVNSCILLAAQCQGRAVTTIEGVARDGALDRVQQAFIDHGAVQCGFCTSGMLLSAVALLREDPAPTPERVVEYLRGNLCRCTGYRKLVEAIVACGRAPGGTS